MDETLTKNMIELFKTDKFPNELGIKIEECARGYAKVSLKTNQRHTNIYNRLHGGVLFSVADQACGVSTFTLTKGVAMQTNIAFLKSIEPGGVIYGESNVYRAGTRVINATLKITDDSSELLAKGEGICMRFEQEGD